MYVAVATYVASNMRDKSSIREKFPKTSMNDRCPLTIIDIYMCIYECIYIFIQVLENDLLK